MQDGSDPRPHEDEEVKAKFVELRAKGGKGRKFPRRREGEIR
jgi:hypothetical protein